MKSHIPAIINRIISLLDKYTDNKSLQLKYENITSTPYEIAVPVTMQRSDRSKSFHLVMLNEERSQSRIAIVDRKSDSYSMNDFYHDVHNDFQDYLPRFYPKLVSSSDKMIHYRINKGLFHSDLVYSRKEIDGHFFFIKFIGFRQKEVMPILDSLRRE